MKIVRARCTKCGGWLQPWSASSRDYRHIRVMDCELGTGKVPGSLIEMVTVAVEGRIGQRRGRRRPS